MGGAVPPLPHTPSWRGAQLGGAQGYILRHVRMLRTITKQIKLDFNFMKIGGQYGWKLNSYDKRYCSLGIAIDTVKK
jgi:hypothetical protein